MTEDINFGDYTKGWKTDIENEDFPTGINEENIRLLSKIKNEPDWLLEFRLKAYHKWWASSYPRWSNAKHSCPDFSNMVMYSAPKMQTIKTLDELPKELLDTYEKLGIPLTEQKRLNNIAIDAVFDSVSLGVTFQEELRKLGIIFCSISEAVRDYPELIKKYLGSVVPYTDNYYASLNSAVFSDGSFIYIPENVKCPMELGTYFRTNNAKSGQFERTLIIADKNSYISYLEGCSAPALPEHQLHAAVVELVALDEAEIKYSTLQNWYPGSIYEDSNKDGVLNFVTKRGICKGYKSKISWTQVETGSAITWKYPSVILKGDKSIGEFYSVSLARGNQQTDTGTKMIHLGKETKSIVTSKSVSQHGGNQTFRALISVSPKADNSYSDIICDSMIVSTVVHDICLDTLPTFDVKNKTAKIHHEASTSGIPEKQKEYLTNKGFSEEEAVSLIVNGFTKDIIQKLPFEFASEASTLLELKMKDTIA